MTDQVETMTRVGVVGCGTMGSGIAEVCAHAGVDVVVAVPGDHSLASGRKLVEASLDKAVAKGKINPAQRSVILDAIRFSRSLDDLAERQIVIEAVHENEEDKALIFRELDRVVEDEAAVLASTTSSIPISRLARVTRRPDRVVGMHFFNPAPVMPLIELVRSMRTADDALATVEKLAVETLGRQVVHSADRAGFVVNALLIPYLLSAIRMVESGVARAEIVDQAMVLGCAHPVGPLKLADLIGLDVVVAIANALYAEFKEQLYAPPPALLRMIESGFLGRKSGQGFYLY